MQRRIYINGIGLLLFCMGQAISGYAQEIASKRLFASQVREQGPSKLFDFVEAAFASYASDSVNVRFANIRFLDGSWEELEAVNDFTPFRWSNINGQGYRLEWQLSGRSVVMVFPIEYDKLNGRTRQEMEDSFIREVKQYKVGHLRPKPNFDKELLQLVRDSLFRLPGGEYLISDVNSHAYLIPDSTGNAVFVCGRKYWVESLANLFVIGSEPWKQARMEVTVRKHEYGRRETFETEVEALVQVCEKHGCKTYWGMENEERDELKFSVLFYNPEEGYNHVFRVTCRRISQGDIPFTLKARASLFVPVSNVDNLFE